MQLISTISDQVADYTKALITSTTIDELIAVLHDYQSIAADAMAAAPRDELEFEQFRAGLKKERRGVFAGTEWSNRFSVIAMPEVMLRTSAIACKYKVPWGLAFIKARDAGKIQIDKNGTARWA